MKALATRHQSRETAATIEGLLSAPTRGSTRLRRDLQVSTLSPKEYEKAPSTAGRLAIERQFEAETTHPLAERGGAGSVSRARRLPRLKQAQVLAKSLWHAAFPGVCG